jgi:hypothetical protein
MSQSSLPPSFTLPFEPPGSHTLNLLSRHAAQPSQPLLALQQQGQTETLPLPLWPKKSLNAVAHQLNLSLKGAATEADPSTNLAAISTALGEPALPTKTTVLEAGRYQLDVTTHTPLDAGSDNGSIPSVRVSMQF